MIVVCEVCGKNLTEAGETEYVCDECGNIVCADCCSGGFHIICKKCES